MGGNGRGSVGSGIFFAHDVAGNRDSGGVAQAVRVGLVGSGGFAGGDCDGATGAAGAASEHEIS